MKQLLVTTVLVGFSYLGFPITSFGQSEIKNVGKGRILTSDGLKIKFHDLAIGDNSHRYRTSQSSPYIEYPSSKTVRIEQQTGSEVLKWAAITGLSGLTGSLLGVAQAKNQGYDPTNVAPIVIGFTAGFALIGGVIGLGKKKYKSVYSNPKYNTGMNTYRWQFDLAFAKQRTAVGVRYQF